MTAEDLHLLAFGVVVFASYVAQTLTGFGGSVVCVTLGAQILPLEDVITYSVPISFVQTTYMLVRHHEGIDRNLIVRRIVPLMIAGMAISFVFFSDLHASWLEAAFGAMVVVLSGRELFQIWRHSGEVEARPLPRVVSNGAMFGAGIVHGIFAAGGPLLVYAVSREGLKKRAFRSTLAAVWLVMNVIMLVRFAMQGRYDAATGITLLWLLPAAPLGIALGEWLYDRVNERRFKIAVFALLGLAAVPLLVRPLL